MFLQFVLDRKSLFFYAIFIHFVLECNYIFFVLYYFTTKDQTKSVERITESDYRIFFRFLF